MTARLRIVDPLYCSDRPDEAVSAVLEERHAPPHLTRKLKAYYLLRPIIPRSLRHFLQHRTRPSVPDDWFIDRRLLDLYARTLAAGERRRIVDLWPHRKRWGLSLTHDVEEADGFRGIERIAALEERYGFRSSWNIVAHRYPIDHGYLAELKARGFEIGVHGYNHDGKDFLSRALFRKRARRVNAALARHGAVGYRSPQAQRNLEWMQDLEVDYDSSCFDVDPFQPMPGGTASIWPFRAGRFIEIPYTVPQDHVLFITLREVTNSIWRRKTDWLIAHRGLVCLITHPDYLAQPKIMAHYEDYLAYLREKRDGWPCTPAELAAWWRAREQSCVTDEGASGPASEHGAGILEVYSVDDKLEFAELT